MWFPVTMCGKKQAAVPEHEHDAVGGGVNAGQYSPHSGLDPAGSLISQLIIIPSKVNAAVAATQFGGIVGKQEMDPTLFESNAQSCPGADSDPSSNVMQPKHALSKSPLPEHTMSIAEMSLPFE